MLGRRLGDVDHRAGVDVGLGHGVGRRAGDERAGNQRAGRLRAVDTIRSGDLVVGDSVRRGQRDVAAVGHLVAVEDRVAGLVVVERDGALLQRQRRALAGRHGHAVLVRQDRVRAVHGRRLGRVGYEAGVEVVLGHVVGGRAGDELAGHQRVGRLRAVHRHLVVADAIGRRQGHVAAVGHLVAVDNRVADAVIAGRRRRLVQRQGRRLNGGHGHGVLVGVHRVAVVLRRSRGDVDHRAGGDVGLGHGVGRRAGDELTRIERVRRLRAAHRVRRDDLVVTDRIRRRQGHVAAVGQLVAVEDRVADLVIVARGRRLVQRQGRPLHRGHVHRVRVRGHGGRAVHGRGRGDIRHRAGVDVGLGHGVGGRAGEELAGQQRAGQLLADHCVRRDDLVVRRGIRRLQRDVAAVGHLVGVLDGVADGVVVRRQGVLVQHQGRALQGRHGHGIRVGGHGGVAVLGRGRGDVDHRAGVEVSLRHVVGGGAGDERAGHQRAGRLRAAHRVGGDDVVVSDGVGRGQGDVAAVGQLVGVGDRVAHAVVVDRGRVLVQRQGRRLNGGHGFGVLVGVHRLVVVLGRGRGHVDHLAGGQVGLGDGVGRRAEDEVSRHQRVRRLRAADRIRGDDLVVTDGVGGRQGHVAAVGQLIAVEDRVADLVIVGRRRRLIQRQLRRLRPGHGHRVGVGRDGVGAVLGRAGGDVGHRAGGQVSLGDGIGGRAGEEVARVQRVWRLLAHDRVRRDDLVVRDGIRRNQRDVAAVGHLVAVADRVADGVEATRRRRLVQRQFRVLVDGDGVVVGVGRRLGRVGRHRVGQVAAGVHLRQRHRVGAAVDPRLGQVELAVAVGVARRAGDGRGALRVADRHVGQGDVAGVGHREGVGHDLAGGGDDRRRRGLDHVQRRQRHGHGVLVGGDRVAVVLGRGRGDVDHLAGGDVGRGDGVGGRAGDGRADGQRAGRLRAVDGGLVVADGVGRGHRHVAAVGHQVAVADGVASSVIVSRRRRLVQRQGRGLHRRNRHRVRVGRDSVGAVLSRAGGDVGHRAGGQVSLGDGVGRRAGERVARVQRVRRLVARHRVRRDDLVVRDGIRRNQGDVAAVGHRVVVADRVADLVVIGRGRRLVQRQFRVLIDGDGVVIGVGRRLGRVGRDGVSQVAAGVHLRQCHRVGAAVDPRLGQVKLAVAVGVARRAGDGRGALRVADRHVGQGDVAGVGHREGVGHDLAGGGDDRRRRGLDHVQRRQRDRHRVLVGGHRVAAVLSRGRGDVDHLAGGDVGRGHGVGRRAGDRAADRQRVGRLRTAHRVRRDDLVVADAVGRRQGHVAAVGQQIAVADGVAGSVIVGRGRRLVQRQRRHRRHEDVFGHAGNHRRAVVGHAGAVLDLHHRAGRDGIDRHLEAHLPRIADGQIAQRHTVGQRVIQREGRAAAVVGNGYPTGAHVLLGCVQNVGRVGGHVIEDGYRHRRKAGVLDGDQVLERVAGADDVVVVGINQQGGTLAGLHCLQGDDDRARVEAGRGGGGHARVFAPGGGEVTAADAAVVGQRLGEDVGPGLVAVGGVEQARRLQRRDLEAGVGGRLVQAVDVGVGHVIVAVEVNQVRRAVVVPVHVEPRLADRRHPEGAAVLIRVRAGGPVAAGAQAD